jgi:hypothetical protein
MKRILFFIVALFAGATAFFGCSKNTPYVTTVNPALSAKIGPYTFTASSVYPATIDTQQRHDSATTLKIIATTADRTSPKDQIILYINRYTGITGTFSIVQGQSAAYYYHNGVSFTGVYGQIYDTAIGGIVAITRINDNSITGYFSFNATNSIAVTNGTFTVGKPWNF